MEQLKQERIQELEKNESLGIVFGSGGFDNYRIMTYRAYLDYFATVGFFTMEVKENILIHSNGSNEYQREVFETHDLAVDAYYKYLEKVKDSSTLAGGVFYENAQAIEILKSSDNTTRLF